MKKDAFDYDKIVKLSNHIHTSIGLAAELDMLPLEILMSLVDITVDLIALSEGDEKLLDIYCGLLRSQLREGHVRVTAIRKKAGKLN